MQSVNSKIISKIQKLLALGEKNSNQNEAHAAILKAHQLMAAYGISEVNTNIVDEQISYSEEYCEHKGNRKFRRNLSNVIAPNFKCQCYLSNKQVVFFGRSTDARIAKQVFEYAYLYAFRESNRLYVYMTSDVVTVLMVTAASFTIVQIILLRPVSIPYSRPN